MFNKAVLPSGMVKNVNSKKKKKTPQKANSIRHYLQNKFHLCGYCQSLWTVYDRKIIFFLNNMSLKDA